MNDSNTLYAAESAVEHWLKEAFSRTGLVTVNKREYRPEAELKFGRVEDIQRYVDRVLDLLRDNGVDFGGQQNVPIKVRERAGNTKAVYSYRDSTIAIPPHQIGGTWAMRELVVLHEMTHHLTPGSGHHGPDFRANFLRLLESVGKHVTAEMMHESYCNAGLSGVGHEVAESTLDKIAKLLRQAEGTDNDAEAKAFTEMAQRLATKHSVALTVARAKAATRDKREEPVVEYYSVAVPRQRGNQERIRLIHHIAQVNDVRITIYRGNTAVDMYGFQSDIDVVKALFESLSAQMEFAYAESVKREPVAYEEHYRFARNEDGSPMRDSAGNRIREVYATTKIHGTTRRITFYDGFQTEVGQRLRAAHREAKAEMEQSVDWSEETALVVRGKEVEVTDFYKDKTKHIRGSWGTTSRGSGAGYHAGRQAGSRASLGGERQIG